MTVELFDNEEEESLWYSSSGISQGGGATCAKGHYQDAYLRVRELGRLIGDHVEGSKGSKRSRPTGSTYNRNIILRSFKISNSIFVFQLLAMNLL